MDYINRICFIIVAFSDSLASYAITLDYIISTDCLSIVPFSIFRMITTIILQNNTQ